ncbi:hypothetical protein PILCRDRAFT_15396 [Piloderma croceum F 1598]|uniref:Uncharacterized protein n=1 Tax=Piloderma croceum (strain F 1598) TaxID=765440 RepID=A0A0C3EZ84_PILCF|nr:hypothetical protein PILCRDRAFT_15396 [Piloderma croceum F 1598]
MRKYTVSAIVGSSLGTDEDGIVATLFAGINTAPNHTSAEQFEGWMALIQELAQLWRESGSGNGHEFNQQLRLKGLLTDHALDQLLLQQLLHEWKEYCDRVSRGDSILESSEADVVTILMEATQDKVADAGGQEAWDQLSIKAKAEFNDKTYNQVRCDLRDKAFDALSKAEKREGGNVEMQAYWHSAEAEPPKLLRNRDNAAAANLGGVAAQKRANDISQGGRVKTMSLASAIFNNKDDKKGQQDTFCRFFESKLGYIITFPGTSAIRYGSHCEAAGVLILYLPLFLEFLELVRSKKESGMLNHMENNVYIALQDIPTITELCVLALYGQAISHPYIVRALCKRITKNPDLLLAPDATHVEGSLDGEIWHQADIVYAIHKLIPELPHIRGTLSAFFCGAGKTWPRFSEEFKPRGAIALLLAEERQHAFMNATNDHNEGALGAYRVGARQAPSMTLVQWNAQAMYKQNHTHQWIKSTLASKQLSFLRHAARTLDGSKLEKKRHQAQAEADAWAAAKKRVLEVAKMRKCDAAKAMVDTVQPILNLNVL